MNQLSATNNTECEKHAIRRKAISQIWFGSPFNNTRSRMYSTVSILADIHAAGKVYLISISQYLFSPSISLSSIFSCITIACAIFTQLLVLRYHRKMLTTRSESRVVFLFLIKAEWWTFRSKSFRECLTSRCHRDDKFFMETKEAMTVVRFRYTTYQS